MTEFGYRPKYEWLLWWNTGTGVLRRNITPYVLRHRVKFGCYWNPRAGAVQMAPAKGHLVLDTGSGVFDLDGPNSIFAGTTPTGPMRVAYGVAGSRFVWLGIALTKPAPLLNTDRTMRWQLRGRWWQGLQQRVLHRHVSQGQTFGDLMPLAVTPADFLEEMLDTMGDIVGENAAGIRATITSPAGITWLWPYVSSSAANNINQIAVASASVPYETSNGSVGMRPYTSILNERASRPAPPSGQRWYQRRSGAEWEVRTQPWAVRVSGPTDIQLADSGVPAVTSVTVPATAWRAGGAGGAQRVATVEAVYTFPNDIYGVIWDTRIPTPQGWIRASVRAESIRNGRGDRLVVTGVADSDRPETTLQIRGWRIISANERRVVVDFTSGMDDPARSIIELPSWFAWQTQSTVQNLYQLAYAAHMAVANRTMLRVTGEFPLWGPNASAVVRRDQLQPGQYTQHRCQSNVRYGGMVETVEYVGERGKVPRVRVTTLDLSGTYRLDGLDQTGLPDTTPPPPVFVTPIPNEGTIPMPDDPPPDDEDVGDGGQRPIIALLETYQPFGALVGSGDFATLPPPISRPATTEPPTPYQPFGSLVGSGDFS